MLSRLLKPLNIVCILCYMLFMGFAFNSKIVDALVLYVTEENGKPVYVTKKKQYAAIVGQDDKKNKPLIAIRYNTKKHGSEIEADEDSSLSGLEDNDGKELEDCEGKDTETSLLEEEEEENTPTNAKASEKTTSDEDVLTLESSVTKASEAAKAF